MSGDITTTASRIVYENRWMWVREDAIRRRDGSTGIYGVVDKRDFVVIAPINQAVIHVQAYLQGFVDKKRQRISVLAA